jgi:hypothetical protein
MKYEFVCLILLSNLFSCSLAGMQVFKWAQRRERAIPQRRNFFAVKLSGFKALK